MSYITRNKSQFVTTIVVIMCFALPIVVSGQPWNDTGDSLIITLPVKFDFPSIQIHQPQIKASQTRSLQATITELLPIALAMYMWRDDLTAFSNKHDKISHGVLAYGLSRYFGFKFAAGFMLSIELTQIDIFKLEGRYKDTAGDMLANSVGMLLAWKIKF